MARIGVFGLAGLEAALLLYLAIQHADGPGSGGQNGGPEMELFFAIVLPSVVLAGAVAVFRFARSPVLRWLAALTIVIPVLVLAYLGIARFGLERAVQDDATGRGLFTNRPAKDLAEAIVQGDTAKAAALLPGVDINQPGRFDETFLRLAIERTGDKAALVAALLQAGADPNEHVGWPLRQAVGSGDLAMVTVLLDAGADPNQADQVEPPVFFLALDRPGLLAVLLSRGARLDTENADGRTALATAVRQGRWPAVDMLLAAGADPRLVGGDSLDLLGTIALVKRQKEALGEPVPAALLELDQRLRMPR